MASKTEKKPKNTQVDPTKEEIQELEKSLSPAGRELLGEVRKFSEKESSDSLRANYRLGTIMKHAQQNEAKYQSDEYGGKRKPIIRTMARLTGYCESYMSNVVVFARTYSPSNIEYLTSVRTSRGKPIRWNHIHLLLLYRNDQKQHDELFNKIVEEDWSPEQLHTEIKRRRSGPAHGGGRPITKPNTMNGQLEQLAEFCRKFDRQYMENWADPHEGLVTRESQIPSDQLKPGLIELISDAGEALDVLIKRASVLKEHVDDILSSATERMEKHTSDTEADTPQPEVRNRGRARQRQAAVMV